MVAVAYGGRWDIAQACRALAGEVAAGTLAAVGHRRSRKSRRGSRSAVFPTRILLIRTGGEQRISNFLLWNLAYTETVFLRRRCGRNSRPAHLRGGVRAFCAERERRFGKTSAQLAAQSRCLGCVFSPPWS